MYCFRYFPLQQMRNFDGAIFFIINKAYRHAKLAQWGTGGRDIGTYEQRVYPDQLWRLEAEPQHPGYYYICNVQNNGYRIAKWGKDDQAVGNYNVQYFDDQLWKFEKYGDFTGSSTTSTRMQKLPNGGKAIVRLGYVRWQVL